MSLTSYRAAPPRDGCAVGLARLPRGLFGIGVLVSFLREVSLFRFGGDLLSHVLRRSTIGATALNGRVRDGIGCFARAMTTKPEKRPGVCAVRIPPNISFAVHFWTAHIVPCFSLRAFDDPDRGILPCCFRIRSSQSSN